MPDDSIKHRNTPTATELRAKLAARESSALEALEVHIGRIDECEPRIKSFAYFDASLPRDAARCIRVDDDRPLVGVPIGVKDIIDTADMPTQFNSPLYQDRRPAVDAAVVAALRAQGAIIMGKTTTVEFAALGRVAETVNPHNAAHTPGGSSSGSAAAVAAGMVPIAVATQTGGSTIRPASFCGVAALKPTFGVVPIAGVRPYAPSLDTVGFMARTVADLMLIADALRISLGTSELASDLTLGVYRTPYWHEAGDATRRALATARARLLELGVRVIDVDGPPDAGRLNEAQDIIMHGEGRQAFLAEHLLNADALHAEIRAEVNNAKGIDRARLRWAYDYLGAQRPRFDDALAECDAWLTPATPGEAPMGLGSTGDAVFNRLWTGLHVPCVTLPAIRGRSGLPVGVQLVARRFDDDRLLQVAARVEHALHCDGAN